MSNNRKLVRQGAQRNVLANVANVKTAPPKLKRAPRMTEDYKERIKEALKQVNAEGKENKGGKRRRRTKKRRKRIKSRK